MIYKMANGAEFTAKGDPIDVELQLRIKGEGFPAHLILITLSPDGGLISGEITLH